MIKFNIINVSIAVKKERFSCRMKRSANTAVYKVLLEPILSHKENSSWTTVLHGQVILSHTFSTHSLISYWRGVSVHHCFNRKWYLARFCLKFAVLTIFQWYFLLSANILIIILNIDFFFMNIIFLKHMLRSISIETNYSIYNIFYRTNRKFKMNHPGPLHRYTCRKV